MHSHHLQRLTPTYSYLWRSTTNVTKICQITNYYRALTSTTTPGVVSNNELHNNNNNNNNNNTDTPKRTSYVDEWFESIVKPTKFYEDCAAPGQKRKLYFYNVDLQGRVFLEDTWPKNIATSIKNTSFLDVLFRRMKRVEESSREHQILREYASLFVFRDHDNTMEQDAVPPTTVVDDATSGTHNDIANDYPYVSPCGVELNFVRPADSVIVFHSLFPQDNNTENVSKQHTVEEPDSHGKEEEEQQPQQQLLSFAGSLTQPFDPQKLAISPITGRLYHELVTPENGSSSAKKPTTPLHKTTKNERNTSYGLIRSSVAVSLSDQIVFNSNRKEKQQTTTDEYSEMDFVSSVKDDNATIDTNDKNIIMPSSYPIRWLPSYAEPGSWAMPFHDDIHE
mmetsp:Transcript_4677/g.7112  ORF Transcript_4677/g.7112 Transcript_4677/m.7112 type:complete len:394 (-) Transcript_4677:147-1328(-)